MVLDRVEGVTAEHFPYNNPDMSHPIRLHKDFVKNFQETLDYMRSKGIEISDLEPRNIMINKSGLAVIVDTGCCYMPSNGETCVISGDEAYQRCLSWAKRFFEENFYGQDFV